MPWGWSLKTGYLRHSAKHRQKKTRIKSIGSWDNMTPQQVFQWAGGDAVSKGSWRRGVICQETVVGEGMCQSPLGPGDTAQLYGQQKCQYNMVQLITYKIIQAYQLYILNHMESTTCFLARIDVPGPSFDRYDHTVSVASPIGLQFAASRRTPHHDIIVPSCSPVSQLTANTSGLPHVEIASPFCSSGQVAYVSMRVFLKSCGTWILLNRHYCKYRQIS